MKHFILSIALLSCFFTTKAQTMYIWQKGVATAVNENTAEDIVFSADGLKFTVLNQTFDTQTIDSIVFGTETIDPQKVDVTFDGEKATAILPINISDSVSVSIDGAYVTATSASLGGMEVTYALTGKSSNGAFVQNGVYKCKLVLNGVDLTSQKGAAIDIQNGKRIDVEVADGTVNNLSDFAGGLQKACFYVKGHPEIFGGGTLNITGNANHAFSSNEYTHLKSTAGKINILSAKGDAMHIGQYFRMKGGSINIRNVDGDGIQAEVTKNPLDTLNGQLLIMGGSIDINVKAEDVKAIRCDSAMTINGGNIKINITGNGSKGITTDTDLFIDESMAPVNIDIKSTGGIFTNPLNPIDTKKSHGINVTGNLTVMAGNIDISATGKKGKAIKVDGFARKSQAATVKTNPNFNWDEILL